MATFKNIKPETATQMAVIEWIKLTHPKIYPYVIKIPNENSFRGYAISMGFHIGASDLFIAYPIAFYHGCFLEIKPPGYKVNKSNIIHHFQQIDFINKMEAKFYYSGMKIGVDECISFLKNYFDLI